MRLSPARLYSLALPPLGGPMRVAPTRLSALPSEGVVGAQESRWQPEMAASLLERAPGTHARHFFAIFHFDFGLNFCQVGPVMFVVVNTVLTMWEGAPWQSTSTL